MERDNSFEQCMKCTICNDYCPVTRADKSFPGPKTLGPDGERYRLKSSSFYDDMARYCLNCKRCEVACPSDVRIADLILKAKLRYGGHSHLLRNAALSHTDFLGALGTAFSPVANAAASVMFKGGPRYASRTFEKIYSDEFGKGSQDAFPECVSYFHGCYVNYNNPGLGRDLVGLLNAAGVGVKLLDDEKCCGIALISNGFEDAARKGALTNLAAIRRSAGKGLPVVTTSTTCAFTMRDEYAHILGIDNNDVRDSIVTATRYLFELIDSGKAELKFRSASGKLKVAYHMPCHLEKLGWGMYTIELLRMISGIELTVLDSCCCGIAGTYGFKRENRAVSREVGRPLFEQIRSLEPDLVVTDCETCRWQIEMNTGLPVAHPVTLLYQSLER